MQLFGGRRGLIENSQDLCRAKRRAELQLRAHNGKKRVSNLVIDTGCGKKGKKRG